MSARPNAGGPKLRRLNMGQIFIILAVVSAILTIIVINSLMGNQSAPQKSELKTKPLVVATQQLLSGEIIGPGSIKTIDWPVDHYPKGANVYEDPNKLLGRVVKRDVYPGEPVYRLSLAGEESSGGLPVVIPHGYRAMTIQVTETKGVGGFVKPGDHVDIIGSFEYDISESAKRAASDRAGFLLQDRLQIAQTVLQDVQVLAIAQEMYQKTASSVEKVSLKDGNQAESSDAQASQTSQASPDSVKPKLVSSVTLAVTPEQAEKLAFADSRADLRLVLRPENEHEQVDVLGVVPEDVIPLKKLYEKATELAGLGWDPALLAADPAPVADDPKPAPAYKPQRQAPMPMHKRVRSVELIQGDARTSVSF